MRPLQELERGRKTKEATKRLWPGRRQKAGCKGTGPPVGGGPFRCGERRLGRAEAPFLKLAALRSGHDHVAMSGVDVRLEEAAARDLLEGHEAAAIFDDPPELAVVAVAESLAGTKDDGKVLGCDLMRVEEEPAAPLLDRELAASLVDDQPLLRLGRGALRDDGLKAEIVLVRRGGIEEYI